MRLDNTMKRSFAVALLIAALGILGSAAPGTNAPSSTNDRLVDFVRNYDKAWNRKDVPSLERALAADYVYFTSKGDVWSRQRTLDLLRSPKYILNSAERTEIEVYLTGKTAIVSSRWQGHGSYNGEEFRDDQRCSIVLARAGRGWKVLAEHCTQIATR
jgi:ketosteroid isomerase-like protein